MGRGKHYTIEERRIALTLRNEGKYLREILNRSFYFIPNVLKEQPSVQHSGRPMKISPLTDNHIITMAQTKTHSFLAQPFLQRLITLFHPERY